MEPKVDGFKEIHVSYTFKKSQPWRILKKLELELSNGEIAIIPKDYFTDFASVPKLLWGLFPPYGIDLMAFLFHDYCYDFGGYKNKKGKFIFVSKSFTDKEMKFQQLKVGVSKLRVYPMYLAVRVFGRGNFKGIFDG